MPQGAGPPRSQGPFRAAPRGRQAHCGAGLFRLFSPPSFSPSSFSFLFVSFFLLFSLFLLSSFSPLFPLLSGGPRLGPPAALFLSLLPPSSLPFSSFFFSSLCGPCPHGCVGGRVRTRARCLFRFTRRQGQAFASHPRGAPRRLAASTASSLPSFAPDEKPLLTRASTAQKIN